MALIEAAMSLRKRRDGRMPMRRSLLAGSIAGAAGTTALNAVTYLDMTVRGRPESETPKQTAEALSSATGVPIPGDSRSEEHRASAVGALLGIASGVGIGAGYGVLRAAGLSLPRPAAMVTLALAALVASNGPMTALGVTDPRQWSAVDWTSDVVPHLVYGGVTAFALSVMDAS